MGAIHSSISSGNGIAGIQFFLTLDTIVSFPRFKAGVELGGVRKKLLEIDICTATSREAIIASLICPIRISLIKDIELETFSGSGVVDSIASRLNLLPHLEDLTFTLPLSTTQQLEHIEKLFFPHKERRSLGPRLPQLKSLILKNLTQDRLSHLVVARYGLDQEELIDSRLLKSLEKLELHVISGAFGFRGEEDLSSYFKRKNAQLKVIIIWED
ncbi:hypothetical protein FRC03_004627 [Tulasnella sp. 419]|nr:hypothetical protein FRC03_004627 [Tulasnella sp. 419]